jgi:uncharacterized membrane protein YuzA (DUF378 family)
MKSIDRIATALLVIGGLNWGLVGLANFDLVAAITGAGSFGNKNALGTLIYVLVGLAAGYRLVGWKAIERRYVTA